MACRRPPPPCEPSDADRGAERRRRAAASHQRVLYDATQEERTLTPRTWSAGRATKVARPVAPGPYEQVARDQHSFRQEAAEHKRHVDNMWHEEHGIDFNVFNFLLEGRLKDRGIPTAHYVSPSVYAWRRSRTKRVARSADVIFCLFPFEPVFYTGLPVKAIFVGHPLAHEITELDTRADKQEWARVQLGVADSDVILAMLPGSRGSEIELMLEPFLQAAEIIQASFSAQNKAVKVIIPCINLAREEQVRKGMESTPQLDIHIHKGQARLALLACDAALVKSGTSTLEAMLLKRPMVVSYRLGYWSHWVARLLVKTTYVAMPNILSNKKLVPELLQDDAQPEGLAQALLSELANSRSNEQYFEPFANMRKVLEDGEFGLGASKTAAQGIVDLLQEKGRL